MQKRFSVIGGGSWATALVKILTYNNHDVKWWVRTAETKNYINTYGHNPKYLSSVQFDTRQDFVTNDIIDAVNFTDVIILALPSVYLQDSISKTSPIDWQNKTIISAIKGVAPGNSILISDYLQTIFDIDLDKIIHLCGPCHAEEVAAERLSYLTFSSTNVFAREEIAKCFNNRYIITDYIDDIVGTEYAAILKNIYAIATGISIGLGYGDNFRAVMVSHCMNEMMEFLDKAKPEVRNMMHPSYMGDLLVTCYSQHSRNRAYGIMLGKGYTSAAANLELGMVAEGYYSSKALYNKLREYPDLNLPIVTAVYKIIFEHQTPEVIYSILSKSFKN
ncbi:MAG: NAD(P)H-dependent glycerol-3-phosphate dehydrogenase [Bacteroidota bacterium]|nr:NAD(P)H-dependent glycerol-3-phosphate dehydrogenase [Bacteroidota bacterium]